MGNILIATVIIKGVRPLWWHKFGPDALPLEKQERSGVAGNAPEEWRRTVLVTRDGQLYLDPTYVFSTLREGARHTKKGKGSIQSNVSATLQIVNDRILINRYFPGFPNGHSFDIKTAITPSTDFDELVYLDIRGVRNPSTKARNVRYRIATKPDWITTFDLQWDKTIVSRGEMESVCIDSGRLVGMGNGRSIGMGRFEVTAFEIVE